MKRSPANATIRAQTLRRLPASKLPALLAALGLAVGAVVPLAVHADGGGSGGRPNLTLDEAVSRVRRETRGRILSADTERVDGREEYRVRVLTDQGQVRGYRLDAGDGSFRSRERRDRRNR